MQRQLPNKSVVFLPEWVRTDLPNESFSLAQEIKRRAAGRLILGCFGQFDKRKGGLDFLRTAQQAQGLPWFFVWVGSLIGNSFSSAELELIKRLRQQLKSNTLVLFEKVPDWHDFNSLVQLSDGLFLPYADHAGSSNMVHTAAVFRKSIVVSDGYCMADDTRKYNLGLICSRGNIDDYVSGLRALFGARRAVRPDYDGYLRDHSDERRNEAIRRMIEAGLA